MRSVLQEREGSVSESDLYQLFNRRITKRTPGIFQTRLTHPRGHPHARQVSYKFSKVKQYFKEGRALRTRTTMNNTHDFGIGGRLLQNLPAVRAIGFAVNRRLLEVETFSQDCVLAERVFEQVTPPQVVAHQRVAGLRFDDPRVLALMQVLCLCPWLFEGFRNADLRREMARALGLPVGDFGAGRMTYDLRSSAGTRDQSPALRRAHLRHPDALCHRGSGENPISNDR